MCELSQSMINLSGFGCGSGRNQHSQQKRGGAGAEHKADDQLPRALRHDHSENPARIRSKRHSNSKLLCALAYRKTHHAVETHGGENKRNATENREQTHHDAIAGKSFVMQSSDCAGKINRYIRIKLS